ncbi:MAG: GIY-YIG nuclease family protein [Bacteroidota bacterium]
MFFRMFWVYILYSNTLDRYYVGETQDLADWLILHNLHVFSKAHTANATDWRYRWCLPCATRHQARSIESVIKKMKSRKFIEKLMVSDSTWLYDRVAQ